MQNIGPILLISNMDTSIKKCVNIMRDMNIEHDQIILAALPFAEMQQKMLEHFGLEPKDIGDFNPILNEEDLLRHMSRPRIPAFP